ncbi:MAG: hypothetical protein SWI22_03325 [Pseudomonadota bacterium]|nr:hypothetical protein [Pseudomonadota bacterium]
MSDKSPSAEDPRQGPLHPAAGDGVVVIKDPPLGEMLMTPDEADISGIRMLDAAEEARKPPHARGARPAKPPASDQ